MDLFIIIIFNSSHISLDRYLVSCQKRKNNRQHCYHSLPSNILSVIRFSYRGIPRAEVEEERWLWKKSPRYSLPSRTTISASMSMFAPYQPKMHVHPRRSHPKMHAHLQMHARQTYHVHRLMRWRRISYRCRTKWARSRIWWGDCRRGWWIQNN